MIFYKTIVYAAHPPYTTDVTKYDGPVISADDWEEAKMLCRFLYPYAQVTGEVDERMTSIWNETEEETQLENEHKQDSEEIY